MHILTLTKPVRHIGGILEAGEWLCNDDYAFQLALFAERGSASVSKWASKGFASDHEGWKLNPEWVKSILLIRSGAIGDLLLLTPAIKALRAKYPQAQIWLSCFKKHWDIFAQGDTHFVEYPLPASEVANFDLIIPLENVVEIATEKGVHATDAFAEALGVTVTDYKPVYKVTAEESEFASTAFPKSQLEKKKGRVGLQIHASSIVRGYPMKHWNAVMQELVTRGWEVMLLGNVDGIKGAPPQIRDCSNLTFRAAAAVLATCDVFCGVDSAFLNLCPALGVPAIGLFGPVDWRTRIKEGSGQRALTGTGCEPCGWMNSKAGAYFPPGKPCTKERQCVLLETIKPERIVAKIEEDGKK